MKQIKEITLEQYKVHKREGDGVCNLCYEWSFGVIEPLKEQGYCDSCSNRSLVGIERAKQLGLVEIK